MNRLVEFIIAAILIVALSPLLLVVTVLVVLDTEGEAFFLQERVGIARRPFTMIKFRTMIKGADGLGGYSTQTGDSRITRVGGFLRKTSIDELPQLLNVIGGTMSLVGPRPDVERQLKYYSEADLELRLSVRPGITGLAQATLRSKATAEERLLLDLQYIAEKSLKTDIKIIIKTIFQVLGAGGH